MAKNVIIMGATSGLGEALARRFAALGCDIAIAGRRTERLEALARELRESNEGIRVFWDMIDVRSPEAPLRLSHLSDQIGGVDLYIHASGIGHENTSLEPTIELETAETNALGFVRCVDTAVTLLRSQGRDGQIAAISSVASTRGLGASPAYSATKALQAHYLEALRQMSLAKGWDITVTDIRPGFVDTPLLEGKSYPMTMPLAYAADRIVKAILAKRRVAWIDWKYLLLCIAWRCLPGMLWERLPVGFVPFRTEPKQEKKAAEPKSAAGGPEVKKPEEAAGTAANEPGKDK
ncbi:MAG: SDR family NAD(P)-dependent oxidoreductase [Sutterellaceae bacterium]|nr:SDR family NAD(P)-dependent oxidoreductase [Sutterellaceae bacterium]MDD7442075.1 SDR family NAD(P)-dependent oxidoreductase [Sutterellaceae bacterium]MDY2869138.1 SDR family NAD(P)-dependent oxidoreductase [Mesosutterella sp.]